MASAKYCFRLVEHAEIIKRPAATDMTVEHLDAKPGVREHIVGRCGDVRLKIVRESVRKQ